MVGRNVSNVCVITISLSLIRHSRRDWFNLLVFTVHKYDERDGRSGTLVRKSGLAPPTKLTEQTNNLAELITSIGVITPLGSGHDVELRYLGENACYSFSGVTRM
jgi:hypothetical protein